MYVQFPEKKQHPDPDSAYIQNPKQDPVPDGRGSQFGLGNAEF
jgi:hypothetical protein